MASFTPFAQTPWFNNWLSQYFRQGPSLGVPSALMNDLQSQVGQQSVGAQNAATTDATRSAYNDPALAASLGLLARANARNAGVSNLTNFQTQFAGNQQDFYNNLATHLLNNQGDTGGENNFWSNLFGSAGGAIGSGVGGDVAKSLPGWLGSAGSGLAGLFGGGAASGGLSGSALMGLIGSGAAIP